MWQEPIFDRTSEDTLVARAGQSTIDEHKGALNYQDLNRIEDNYKYLIDVLKSDSIFIPHTYRNKKESTFKDLVEVEEVYTDWREQNIPWLSEINRIRANYNSLVQLFLAGLDLPTLLYSSYLMYTEVNNWERIALVGKQTFEKMKQEYRQCGAYTCGEDGVDWAPYE